MILLIDGDSFLEALTIENELTKPIHYLNTLVRTWGKDSIFFFWTTALSKRQEVYPKWKPFVHAKALHFRRYLKEQEIFTVRQEGFESLDLIKDALGSCKGKVIKILTESKAAYGFLMDNPGLTIVHPSTETVVLRNTLLFLYPRITTQREFAKVHAITGVGVGWSKNLVPIGYVSLTAAVGITNGSLVSGASKRVYKKAIKEVKERIPLLLYPFVPVENNPFHKTQVKTGITKVVRMRTK